MRISDWSSDVCSSDLADGIVDRRGPEIEGPGARKGVDGHQHPRPLLVSVRYGGGHLVAREVQPRKIARVRFIVEAAIDRVGAGLHRRPGGGGRPGDRKSTRLNSSH